MIQRALHNSQKQARAHAVLMRPMLSTTVSTRAQAG